MSTGVQDSYGTEDQDEDEDEDGNNDTSKSLSKNKSDTTANQQKTKKLKSFWKVFIIGDFYSLFYSAFINSLHANISSLECCKQSCGIRNKILEYWVCTA